jgi:hypothetical protein
MAVQNPVLCSKCGRKLHLTPPQKVVPVKPSLLYCAACRPSRPSPRPAGTPVDEDQILAWLLEEEAKD